MLESAYQAEVRGTMASRADPVHFGGRCSVSAAMRAFQYNFGIWVRRILEHAVTVFANCNQWALLFLKNVWKIV
jgi:hypothetical protein